MYSYQSFNDVRSTSGILGFVNNVFLITVLRKSFTWVELRSPSNGRPQCVFTSRFVRRNVIKLFLMFQTSDPAKVGRLSKHRLLYGMGLFNRM